MGADAGFFERLLDGGAFHYTRIPVYWGTMGRLARVLDAQPGERILDVGCGTGVGTRLLRQGYVGIDVEIPYLHYARRQATGSDCAFASMSAAALGFHARSFDKALLINVAHHLDDVLLDEFLVEVARVVRRSVVVLDAAPDTANRVSRFILAHDRGKHVRPRRELRTLLERRYDVTHEEVFHNTLRIASQVLFALAPKPIGAPAAPRRPEQAAPPPV